MPVSALFVQKGGCYFGLISVDPWDEERDARRHNDGPPHPVPCTWPVVAHPPCQRWGKLARVNYARWGGAHNRPGNDGGCFASALASVHRCGGVLEHPAGSYAWAEFGLEKPGKDGWFPSGGGWVCEVWQSAYGHRARKATWLYYYSPLGYKPPEMRWFREPGTHQVGFQDRRGKARNKPVLTRREAAATPIEFRDRLIQLAQYSRGCL